VSWRAVSSFLLVSHPDCQTFAPSLHRGDVVLKYSAPVQLPPVRKLAFLLAGLGTRDSSGLLLKHTYYRCILASRKHNCLRYQGQDQDQHRRLSVQVDVQAWLGQTTGRSTCSTVNYDTGLR
jgi:hypothetical protein